MLMPKRVKYRRVHRGRMTGKALRGNKVTYGEYGPYLYAWTGEFTAGGEFKIGLGNGWGDQFFYAPFENADPLTNHELPMYRFQDDGGDLKWVPSVSGRYTLTLCLLADDMWTKFEPAN